MKQNSFFVGTLFRIPRHSSTPSPSRHTVPFHPSVTSGTTSPLPQRTVHMSGATLEQHPLGAERWIAVTQTISKKTYLKWEPYPVLTIRTSSSQPPFYHLNILASNGLLYQSLQSSWPSVHNVPSHWNRHTSARLTCPDACVIPPIRRRCPTAKIRNHWARSSGATAEAMQEEEVQEGGWWWRDSDDVGGARDDAWRKASASSCNVPWWLQAEGEGLPVAQERRPDHRNDFRPALCLSA